MDLVIAGGTLVDGTGAPSRPATIVIADGRVRILPAGADGSEGEAEQPLALGSAVRMIDARGLVVAPGFIDLHSHSGLEIFRDPRHEPKVRQGVTTEVIGVDGLSYAPFANAADLEALIEMNAGLDGGPGDEPVTWRSVGEYLGRFDGRTSVNIAALVGNTPVRIGALGWSDVVADDRALDHMRATVREALEDGAFGVSTGLDYPPGAYASTDELATLGREAGRLGGIYHSHVRYALGDRFLDPFREAIEIGRRAEVAAHITHFYHRATFPGSPDQMLALVDEARAEGLDVTFDAYPYEWASTRLLIMLPLWIQDGGPAATLERLADRSVRERIRSDLRERGVLFAGAGGLADVRVGAFRRPDNLRWEGRTLGDVVGELGAEPVDVLCDLLVSERLGLNEVTPGPHIDAIRRFYRHPVAMVGTDSTFVGAKPSPRTYGSFPRILGQFVRDEALLSLEDAVRRMTSAPAARLGLRDRGVLRDGAIADVTIFDPVRVRAKATYDEPRRFPDGIEYVVVGGELVVDRGVHTGATPGRGLRRGRD